jgi:hypothetical protein
VNTMARIITQILVGLMLLFGAVTLLPKAYFEFRRGQLRKGIVSVFLACMALFFSCMAFYYAYLSIR